MVWCRQYDADAIYDIIKDIDEEAYVIQSEARSVYGNGFDPLRLKNRKILQPKQPAKDNITTPAQI